MSWDIMLGLACLCISGTIPQCGWYKDILLIILEWIENGSLFCKDKELLKKYEC